MTLQTEPSHDAARRPEGRLKNRSPELAARRADWSARAEQQAGPSRSTIYDWAAFSAAPAVQLRAFDVSCADLHDAIAVGNHEVWGDPLPGHLPGGAVQLRARLSQHRRAEEVHRVAESGLAGTASKLPHAEKIQEAFGHHDLSGVSAHVDGAASEASERLGAHGYASGSSVAFAGSPDLFTAAHEAAHVIQQRGGVALSDGVGRGGDIYERHADEVAGLVVRGQSAEATLDRMVGAGRAASTSVGAPSSATGGAVQALQFKKSRAEAELDQAGELIELEESTEVEATRTAKVGGRTETKVADLQATAKKLSEKLERDIAIERGTEKGHGPDETSRERIAELSALKEDLDRKIASGTVDKATVLDTMRASGHTDHRIESKSAPGSRQGTSIGLSDGGLKREHGAVDNEFVEVRENEIAIGRTRGEDKSALIAGKNGYGVERQKTDTKTGDQTKTRFVANSERGELSHQRGNLAKGKSTKGAVVVDGQGKRASLEHRTTTGGPEGKTIYEGKAVVGTDQLGVEGKADLAKLADKESAISVTVGGGLHASVHAKPVVLEGVTMVALHASARGFLELGVGSEHERAYDATEAPVTAPRPGVGGGGPVPKPSFGDRPAEAEQAKAKTSGSVAVKAAYSRAIVRIYNQGEASRELDAVRRAPSLPLVGATFAKWKAASALLFGGFTPRLPGESFSSTTEAELAVQLEHTSGAKASASLKEQWSWTWSEEVGEDGVVRVKLVAVKGRDRAAALGIPLTQVEGGDSKGEREEIQLAFPENAEGQAARAALYAKLGNRPDVSEVRAFSSRFMGDWSSTRKGSHHYGTRASAGDPYWDTSLGVEGSLGNAYEQEVTIARKEGHVVVDGRGKSAVKGQVSGGGADSADKTRLFEASVEDGGSAHSELVERDGAKRVEARLTTHSAKARTGVGSSLEGFDSVHGISHFVRDALSEKKLDYRATSYSHEEVLRLHARASDHGFWAERLTLVSASGKVQGLWLSLRERLLEAHRGEPALRKRIREQSSTKEVAAQGLRELELGLRQVHVNAFLEGAGAKGPALIKSTIEQAEEAFASRSGGRSRGGDHRAWPDALEAERARFEALETIMKKGLVEHLKEQGHQEATSPHSQSRERKRLIGECDWLDQRLTAARSRYFEDAEAFGDKLQRLQEWRATLADEPRESRTFARSLEMTSRLRTYKEAEPRALTAGSDALLTTTARFYMDWVDLALEARGVMASEDFPIKLSERGAGEVRNPVYEPNVRRVLALWRESGDLEEGQDPMKEAFLRRLLTY